MGMEIDFDAFLDPVDADEDPGLWQNMDVQRHPGARWLITGQATGRRERHRVTLTADLHCPRLKQQSNEGSVTCPAQNPGRSATVHSTVSGIWAISLAILTSSACASSAGASTWRRK